MMARSATHPHETSKVREDLMNELRALYLDVPREAELVDVPALTMLTHDGVGDPTEGPEFQLAIGALYAVAFTLKFGRKAHGLDFRVMPMEADWWTGSAGRFDPARPRSTWRWSLEIAVPMSVTEEEVQEALAALAARRPALSTREVRWRRRPPGRAAHVLHLGPYSAERPTILRLRSFIDERGLRPVGRHHEIYLSDPRRVAPERMRTVIRQPVE